MDKRKELLLWSHRDLCFGILVTIALRFKLFGVVTPGKNFLYDLDRLKHGAGSSVNSAICEDISKFCLKFYNGGLRENIWKQKYITNTFVSEIILSPIFPLIISSAKYPPVSNWSNRPSYLRGRQQLFMGVLFMHWALS